MLFSIFNPPKGKVLRKRSHNIPGASDTTPSRRPTKKSKPTPAPPPTTFKPIPEPPPLPEITLTPGPDAVSSPPPPSKSPRPKPIRRTSLKKKNSHAPAPSTDSLPPLQLDNLVGNGKQEEARPARRKSVIRRVLDKRRERVEAGNNYYNSYILQANGGGERQEYDPMLGVENLPLRQYSGLHIGSPSQLLVDGGTGDRREGRSELGGEEIGVAVSGDEAEERREKRKGREGAETMRGGYWGNFPSHSYGGSYGGLSGVRYVGEHGGGDYGDSTSHGNDHGGYSGGDHDGNGGDGGGGDGGAGGAE